MGLSLLIPTIRISEGLYEVCSGFVIVLQFAGFCVRFFLFFSRQIWQTTPHKRSKQAEIEAKKSRTSVLTMSAVMGRPCPQSERKDVDSYCAKPDMLRKTLREHLSFTSTLKQISIFVKIMLYYEPP